jgi:hypothetical protein
MAELVIEAPAAADLPAAVAVSLELHTRWLAREPGGVRADLRQQRLGGLDLRGVDLSETVLRDTDFSRCDLRGAKFIRADLRFAQLADADLRDADFESANLEFASLRGARLTGAWMRNACLTETNLDGVAMSWFDHALLGERLMRAAGDDLEMRMLASYIGRMTSYCWDDYGHLPVRYRLWLIRTVRQWKTLDDGAPPILDDRF